MACFTLINDKENIMKKATVLLTLFFFVMAGFSFALIGCAKKPEEVAPPPPPPPPAPTKVEPAPPPPPPAQATPEVKPDTKDTAPAGEPGKITKDQDLKKNDKTLKKGKKLKKG